MKNQRIVNTGILIMAAMMLTGLNAQTHRRAGEGPGPHHREFHQRPQRMAQHFSFDLTEEQQEEMSSIKMAHYKTMKPLKNKMAELKARERTILSGENVDMNAVNKVIDQQTDLTNKIRKLQVKHQLEVKSILTEEQVMKLEQRNKVMKKRRPQHREV